MVVQFLWVNIIIKTSTLTLPCKLLCVRSDALPPLTVLNRISFSQVKQGEKKNPKAVHEVPVVGGDFGSDGARHFGFFKSAEGDVEQRADSTEQMQAV
jgi:hypothetical protein